MDVGMYLGSFFEVDFCWGRAAGVARNSLSDLLKVRSARALAVAIR